jgi:effector-binding domain-containing protein
MKRTIFTFLSIIAVIIVLWSLLLKPYDYNIIINANTSQGTCFQSILDWNETLKKRRNISTSIEGKENFKTINQSLILDSYSLDLDWNIKAKNDSTAIILLGVKNKTNSIKDRIEKLFGKSELKGIINDEITNFNAGLLRHLDKFKVKVNGLEKSPETYVAYVNIKSNQKDKAGKMISNSPYINLFLKKNKIKLVSHPFLEIKKWDANSTVLDFNFCFPIKKTDSFPVHKDIKYKKVVKKSSIKATFKGNYSISDRAWYAIHQYAKENNIKLKPTLIEVFYNNPHLGEDEMNWKSEAYMETNN